MNFVPDKYGIFPSEHEMRTLPPTVATHATSASARSGEDDVEHAALDLAERLAREAIELARGEPSVVGHKADALDVVTAADVAIENHFRQRIGERFPSHAVLGEEQGLDPNDRDWTWIVDPID